MNNFMIGMHTKYDNEKFKRDFKEGFYGIEVCSFEDEKNMEFLINKAKEKDFKIGVHFPLRQHEGKARDPQFLSADEIVKADAYKYIEGELEYIKSTKMKVEYILFHYPKPVILKENFDLDNWRFYDRSEYTYETEYTFEDFKRNSEYLFSWLSQKSIQYNFVPVLELDALNKYVCDNDFLEKLLDKYNRVKICLDTGRLHMQSIIDPEFDCIQVIKRFSKYTEVVHLWNVQIGGIGHYPALPSLKQEQGWAPIEEYLKIIRDRNKHFKLLFEHRSDLISDEELENCYSWINSI